MTGPLQQDPGLLFQPMLIHPFSLSLPTCPSNSSAAEADKGQTEGVELITATSPVKGPF